MKNEAINAEIMLSKSVHLVAKEKSGSREIDELIMNLRKEVGVKPTIIALPNGDYTLNLTILPIVDDKKKLVVDILTESTLTFEFFCNHEPT